MFEKLNVARPEWLSSWIIVGLTFVIGCYKYATWNFDVFKKMGVKGPRPWPFFGNIFLINRLGVLKFDLELNRLYGSIVGCFFGGTPQLIIYDVQLLKQILIKDFASFPNRLDLKMMDAPMNKMVVFLKDDHWRHVRSILTPTFSSGKMRKMSSQMNQCCNTLCSNLAKKAETGEVFDLRLLCSAFTMDVIANTAFGIEIDSHNDPNNEFVTKANNLFQFRLSGPLMLFMFSPFLYKIVSRFGYTIIDRRLPRFFFKVVEKTVEQRGKDFDNGRLDFLQIMINAHLENEAGNGELGDKDSKGTKIAKGLTNDELLAQGFLFFLAGYETVANTLSSFVYCMATNPEIQEKLYEEIMDRLGEDDDPTYDSVRDLEYLEMCFSETLRMYPAGPRTDRVPNKESNVNGLIIPKGMPVVIPIYALQNDPEYWEEPTVFNPERFTPANKANIEPLRFMPFGVGPRNCVGMRLAILEIKMSVVKMFRKFKFFACEETEVPLTFSPMSMRPKNGVKLKIKARQ